MGVGDSIASSTFKAVQYFGQNTWKNKGGDFK